MKQSSVLESWMWSPGVNFFMMVITLTAGTCAVARWVLLLSETESIPSMQEKKRVYQVTVRFAHCHLLALGACVQSRRVSDADVPVETQVPVDVQLPVGVQVPVLLLTGSSSSNWSKHRDNR